MTATIKIEGMSCSHCSNAVTKAVSAIDGVSGVKVDLAAKNAVVEYDESKVGIQQIGSAIEEQGYDVVE